MNLEQWLDLESQYYDPDLKEFMEDPRKQGEPYSITITLNPVYHNYTNLARHSLVHDMLYKVLLPRIDYSYIELFPEFTKNNDIHYHGVVFLYNDSSLHRLRNLLKSTFGRSEVVKPKHYQAWYTYMQKDRDLMQMQGYKKIKIFKPNSCLDDGVSEA